MTEHVPFGAIDLVEIVGLMLEGVVESPCSTRHTSRGSGSAWQGSRSVVSAIPRRWDARDRRRCTQVQRIRLSRRNGRCLFFPISCVHPAKCAP